MTASWILFSDMDGTLLSHEGYRYAEALPALHQLKQAGIPVVLNTSKTFAELEDWIERLDIRAPFVVENGSAIYLPIGEGGGGYQVEILGTPIEQLRLFLDETVADALDFTSCSLQQAIDITGLDEISARQARVREYSIPLKFDHQVALANFRCQVDAAGFRLLEGGRFVHLMGATDKVRAMTFLQSWYAGKQSGGQFMTAALGDSPNDAAMLEAADIAVIVQSPSSHKLELQHANLFKTREMAPLGWAEGVEKILDQIESQATYGGLHG